MSRADPCPHTRADRLCLQLIRQTRTNAIHLMVCNPLVPSVWRCPMAKLTWIFFSLVFLPRCHGPSTRHLKLLQPSVLQLCIGLLLIQLLLSVFFILCESVLPQTRTPSSVPSKVSSSTAVYLPRIPQQTHPQASSPLPPSTKDISLLELMSTIRARLHTGHTTSSSSAASLTTATSVSRAAPIGGTQSGHLLASHLSPFTTPPSPSEHAMQKVQQRIKVSMGSGAVYYSDEMTSLERSRRALKFLRMQLDHITLESGRDPKAWVWKASPEWPATPILRTSPEFPEPKRPKILPFEAVKCYSTAAISQ